MHPPSDAEIALHPPALHGYRGPRGVAGPQRPLAVAITRETGARGGAIAVQAAELLGWQHLTPDWLEFAAADPTARAAFDDLPDAAAAWAAERYEALLTGPLARSPALQPLARLTLECAAAGPCVLLGKGAAAILPPEAMLSVRVWAPLAGRIAFIMERHSLSHAEAERHIAERDAGRREYMLGHYGFDPDDRSRYDLHLNTDSFGAARCAELVAAAARARAAALAGA